MRYAMFLMAIAALGCGNDKPQAFNPGPAAAPKAWPFVEDQAEVRHQEVMQELRRQSFQQQQADSDRHSEHIQAEIRRR